jgi:hypothetical protein
MITDTDRDVLKLRREKEAKEREWAKWDRQLVTPQFQEYLTEHTLCVRKTFPAQFMAQEAEHATLGAMLIDEKAAAYTARTLCTTHFHAPVNTLVFSATVQAWRQYMARKSAKALIEYDLIWVVGSLRAQRVLERCGGAAYLTALIEACPSSANVAAYCEQVIEAAQRRALHAASEALQEAVSAEDGQRWQAASTTVAPEPMHPPLQIVSALRRFCDGIESGELPELKQILEAEK